MGPTGKNKQTKKQKKKKETNNKTKTTKQNQKPNKQTKNRHAKILILHVWLNDLVTRLFIEKMFIRKIVGQIH